MSVNQNLDGRLKIVFNKDSGEVQFSHENMEILDIQEVCERIALSLRIGNIGMPNIFEFHPIVEGEEKKLCIAFNHQSKEIQASITGLNKFDACVACSYVIGYIIALIFPPHSIEQWKDLYQPKG